MFRLVFAAVHIARSEYILIFKRNARKQQQNFTYPENCVCVQFYGDKKLIKRNVGFGIYSEQTFERERADRPKVDFIHYQKLEILC